MLAVSSLRRHTQSLICLTISANIGGNFTQLMSAIKRTKTASRIIVQQEGVGLSMLRNVKNDGIKSKSQRNNQGLRIFFVTYLNKNSVT